MNYKFSIFKKARGQTLIELVLVMGLSAIILPALLTGFVASRNGKPQQQQRLQAITVLKETEKAIRNIRNTNWDAISSATVNTSYHIEISGTQWTLQQGTFINTGGITQEVIIRDVYRDPVSGEIVQTGGTIDPSTKKIEIKVSWTKPYLSSVNSILYLTRTKNTTFTQTTQADFNAGIPTDVEILSTNGSPTDGHIALETTGEEGGGEVGGSSADWCEPNLSITARDLPKNGVANAVSAIPGRVFAGTGDNSSGVSFANVNITDTDPPNSSIAGTFNGFKTNDVFGETNYAYLGTDNNGKEIEIINLTGGTYTEAGYFNAPGNGNGDSVFVVGNIGYMTSGDKLYTFDLSSKSGSRPQLGSLTLDGVGNNIYVVGSYVYVAIDSTFNQIEIVQVSNNGATLSKVSSLTVAGQRAQDVIANEDGTRAYLVTSVSSTQSELFIVNTSNKSSLSLISSYEANGMSPKGVTVIPEHNKAIVVGSGGEEYQVIDISNEASPTRCGGLEINTGVNGVSSVFEADGDAYSYIITGDASSELKIIEGGPGGTIVNTNWCSPQDAIINTLTLPKQGNVISAKEGEAFVGTGDGVSGAEFVDIAMTTPPPPGNPTSSVISSFSGSHQTNGVYSDGTYAYLAVNDSSSQVLILSIASAPFTQVGTINVPSGTNANGVYVAGNTAYVTSSNKLYTFDVTNKSGTHDTVLTQVDMYKDQPEDADPIAKQVTVVGSKAYVAAANTPYGLQVFKISSNGTLLELVGVSDLNFSQSATGLSVNPTGTRGYVSFNNGSGSISKGFYIVDTSADDPPDWWTTPNFYPIVGKYSSGSTDPTGVALAASATNRILLTGNGGSHQYHSVDISVEADPLFCGGMTIDQGIKGVSSIVDQFDRGFAYIITGEASNQFKIIQGGSGGGDYTEDGTFESSIFPTNNGEAAFNRFVATVNKPDQATIRMQVAVFPKVNNSCTGAPYTYVGPDGSATSFFNPGSGTISSAIAFGNYSPNYENPAQCFRYKTHFTTWDTSQTPTFNDITVNYSP